MSDQLPDDLTPPDEGFDKELSLAVDRGRLAYEVAVDHGDPSEIILAGDELRRLESRIPEPRP